MFCPACGSEVSPELRFCPKCGAAQPGATPGQTGPAPEYPGAIPPASTPEYSVQGTGPAPPVGIPAPIAVPNRVDVTIGPWISGAWSLVTQDIATFALMTIIFGVLISVVPVVLHGPLSAGFYIACMKKLRIGRADINDMFVGFQFFVPSLVTVILVGLFTFLGFIACIIPGLVIAAMYTFPYLFIVDRGMDFWPAMQASHEVVKRNYFGFTLFVIVMGLLNLAGALCLGVGLLITIPVTFMAVTLAYRDLVGFNPNQNL